MSLGFSALTAGAFVVFEPISPRPLSGFGGGDPPHFPGAAATDSPEAFFPLRQDL